MKTSRQVRVDLDRRRALSSLYGRSLPDTGKHKQCARAIAMVDKGWPQLIVTRISHNIGNHLSFATETLQLRLKQLSIIRA